MPSTFAPYIPLATLVYLTLWSSQVRADEPLHEGITAHVSAGSQGRGRLGAGADINLIPLPGGGRLNGTHMEVAVGASPGGEDVQLDEVLFQLLRWPQIRLGGISRDRDDGMTFGLELGGVSLPLALAGKKESRNWIISHLGVNAGLRWYRRAFCAREDGAALRLSPSFRVDEQVDLVERLSLRAWQKIAYSPLIGRFGDEDAASLDHQLRLSGALGLYLDITPKPLFRQVERVDPVTGQLTTRRSVNQGLRWRWMILRASGNWQPVGYVTGEPWLVEFATGIERRF